MLNKIKNNVEYIYEKRYTEEFIIIKKINEDIRGTINKQLGINTVNNIKIYIFKSGLKFIFCIEAFYKKILLCLFLPFWYIQFRNREKKLCSFSSKKNNVINILIKPILKFDSDNSIVSNLFYRKHKKSLSFKISSILALAETYLSVIKLPFWLKKGLSLIIAENIINEDVVKHETLLFLKEKRYNKVSKHIFEYDDETILYNHAKGYWAIRYLEENYPGFLKEVFHKNNLNIENEIINKLSLSNSIELYWEELDDMLFDHYKYIIYK